LGSIENHMITTTSQNSAKHSHISRIDVKTQFSIWVDLDLSRLQLTSWDDTGKFQDIALSLPSIYLLKFFIQWLYWLQKPLAYSIVSTSSESQVCHRFCAVGASCLRNLTSGGWLRKNSDSQPKEPTWDKSWGRTTINEFDSIHTPAGQLLEKIPGSKQSLYQLYHVDGLIPIGRSQVLPSKSIHQTISASGESSH
jgi:hypothetical protein